MATQIPNSNDNEDYSPSSTLIKFDPPIPLLRIPLPALKPDNPNLGPFILAFPNSQSFISAFKSSELSLLQQCESGVRIGCSISASNKCKPPWWKTLLGKPSIVDFRERNECEEREMRACLDGSKEKCAKFAREKCLSPFGSSRVGFRGRKLRDKEVGRLISCVFGFGVLNLNYGLEFIVRSQLDSFSDINLSYDVNNVRGIEILEKYKV